MKEGFKVKRAIITIFALAILTSAVFGGVLGFIPKTANFVVYFKNNVQNYEALKNVKVFSFLLNDLGIENLLQSSVNQTAISVGIKSSSVWSMVKENFAVFAEKPSKGEAGFEIIAKGSSKVVTGLLSAFVGGSTSNVEVGNLTMKKFEAKGLALYIVDHDGYVLASNSKEILSESVKAYDSGESSFAFKGEMPSDAWFEFYTNAETISEASTLDVVPLDGYGYGVIKDGCLWVNGVARFEYKDKELKAKIESFKSSAVTLEDVPASGDLWLAGDVADPVELYDILEKYSKEYNFGERKFSVEEGRELASSLNGKLFVNASLSSDEENYAVTIYLSKEITKYVPDISKDASATFTWKGHTVLRDDTKEGTRVVHTYTIIYPDKVVITDMEPARSEEYTNATKKAKEMGNFETFEGNIWKDSFVLGYVDLGKIVKSMLQYPITSGLLVQVKFDKDANVVWQLALK